MEASEQSLHVSVVQSDGEGEALLYSIIVKILMKSELTDIKQLTIIAEALSNSAPSPRRSGDIADVASQGRVVIFCLML